LESFIVRIYRRESKKAGNLLGIVETMGLNEKLAFTNRDELWDILIRGDQCLQKTDNRRGASIGEVRRRRRKK
jgi:hypothetical protein